MIRNPRLRATFLVALGSLLGGWTWWMAFESDSRRFSKKTVLVGSMFFVVGIVGLLRPRIMGDGTDRPLRIAHLAPLDKFVLFGAVAAGFVLGLLLTHSIESWPATSSSR